MKALLVSLLAITLSVVGCTNAETEQPMKDTSSQAFSEDLDFLRQHGSVEVLEAPDGGQVALSGKYQGRVMTSAVSPQGASLGWIHRDFISSGQTGTQFDNYGGEDRFWIGPEGGQFSFYFPPQSAFTFSVWQVPSALHEGAWEISEQNKQAVTYTRTMQFVNYSGTQFDMRVDRMVRLVDRAEVSGLLGAPVPDGVQWVGYETRNTLTNIGDNAWEKESGLPSIWMLSMYNPFGETYVVIPFEGEAGEVVVNDTYFGKVPSDRLEVREGYLLFKCDGDYRSKIGIGPSHASSVMGSFNAANQLLTLVQFNRQDGTTDFVNSMWEIQEEPFAGDVVNSYNDGPPEPGKPAMGGFYELESSSPALALESGASYTHIHRTFHLQGAVETLDPLAEAVLGVSVSVVARGIE